MNLNAPVGGASVAIMGMGAVIEDVERDQMRELVTVATTVGARNVKIAPLLNSSAVSPRDRRFLSEDDVMAIAAAGMAITDSGLETTALVDAACIVCNGGKYTRALEADHPRSGFPNAASGFDSLAFDRAVAAGALELNPLRLLQQLDNNVMWWLCKAYKLGGINLQLTQACAPDYSALLEAIAAVAFAESRYAVVGGVQCAAQSAAHVTSRDGELCSEPDVRAGGLAVFFVLGPSNHAGRYGTLHLAETLASSPASKCSVPALEQAMLLLLHALQRTSLQLLPISSRSGSGLMISFEAGA
ncbi:MAG TPA: hypothetical protein VJN18_28655 [Polyangiaceae bacterium]|nr:hypothetical protein [Polyangiaceae bacterium]